MKVMESITSFFRRTSAPAPVTSAQSGFWGYLERDLVQSEKRVIVFEYPRVLCGTDTVQEATDFLHRERLEGRVHLAEIYEHEHDTRLWKRVQPTARPPTLSTLEPSPSLPRFGYYLLGTPGQTHR